MCSTFVILPSAFLFLYWLTPPPLMLLPGPPHNSTSDEEMHFLGSHCVKNVLFNLITPQEGGHRGEKNGGKKPTEHSQNLRWWRKKKEHIKRFFYLYVSNIITTLPSKVVVFGYLLGITGIEIFKKGFHLSSFPTWRSWAVTSSVCHCWKVPRAPPRKENLSLCLCPKFKWETHKHQTQ